MNQPLSLVWGASGKSILAQLPDEVVERILLTTGPASAGGRTLDVAALRTELADIRRQPYVATRGERLPGAVGIASPVFGAGSRVVGSICLTVPEDRFDVAKTDEWGTMMVRHAADELSAALGAPVTV